MQYNALSTLKLIPHRHQHHPRVALVDKVLSESFGFGTAAELVGVKHVTDAHAHAALFV